jgi:hypothetical protein
MSKTSTFEGWQESQSRKAVKARIRSDSAAGRKVTELLEYAGIGVNGPEPWDIQIHDERFFDRALGEGSIGVGESYMDGWWDVPALDEFFTRFRRADLASKVTDLKTALLVIKTRVLNLQTLQRAKQVQTRTMTWAISFIRLCWVAACNIPALIGKRRPVSIRPKRINCT